MKCRVEQQPETFKGTTYYGYIYDEYAGELTGREQCDGIFYIQSSSLLPKYRGSRAVRALSEIIKVVMDDYSVVMSRINSKDNGPIKILLSAGFHIIGTVSYQGSIMVELMKTREDC